MPSQAIVDTLDTIITAIEANDLKTATETGDRLVSLYEQTEVAEARAFSKAVKAKEPGSLTNPFDGAGGPNPTTETTSESTDGFGVDTTERSENATSASESPTGADATLATYASTSATLEPLRGVVLYQFALAIESQKQKLFDALLPRLRKLRSLERQYLEQEASVEDELKDVELPADIEIVGVETPPQSLPVPSDLTVTVIVRNVGEKKSAPAVLEASTGPGLQLQSERKQLPPMSPGGRARIEFSVRLTKQNPHQIKIRALRDDELLATSVGFVIGRVPPEQRVEYDAESVSRDDLTSPNSTADRVGVGLGLFGLLGGGAVGYTLNNDPADGADEAESEQQPPEDANDESDDR